MANTLDFSKLSGETLKSFDQSDFYLTDFLKMTLGCHWEEETLLEDNNNLGKRQ